MRKATKRSLHMSLYIVGGFLLCWIPYYTLSFWLLFKTEEEKQEVTAVRDDLHRGKRRKVK